METNNGNATENSPERKPDGRGRSPGSRQTQFGNVERQERRAADGDVASVTGPIGFDLLSSMRHVFRRPASQDKSQEQRECRKWLRSDRKGFMTKLADLSKGDAGAGLVTGTLPKPTHGQPCPVCSCVYYDPSKDEGSKRAKEALMAWLEANKDE